MKLKSLIMGLTVAAVASVAAVLPAQAQGKFSPKVHRHLAFGNAFLTNSYIVESENGIVVVDPPFTVSSSESLVLQMKSIGKPLLAIISTHHHPDHRFGALIVAGGKSDTPYYAEEGVNKWTLDTDKPKYGFWKKIFGAEIPDKRLMPNKIVKDGQKVMIDGVEYEVGVSGEDESHHGTHWIVKFKDGRTYAFIGDTAMPDFHAWLADGHTKVWVNKTIPALKKKLADRGVRRVFVGHGNSGGLEVFDWQVSYIQTYWKHLRRLASDGAVTKEDKAELTRLMIEHAKTENEAGLVGFSADVVIKELGLQ